MNYKGANEIMSQENEFKVKEVNEPTTEMREVRAFPFDVEAISNEDDYSYMEYVPEGVALIEAPSMWDKGFRGEGIVVAVLDTGIDKDHPMLKDRIIGGRNFTYDGGVNDYDDFNGHGTHVAGTIVGTSQGQDGLFGVAPKAKVLALKVLDQEGSGFYSWIINGIRYAIKWRGPNGERVRVISMSLGGPQHVPDLEKAINEAIMAGIPVVVAAGNEGDDKEDTFEYAYPANYNHVISVSAVTNDKVIAPFSNNNKEVDVVAPGVDVLSSFPGGRFARISGTSMATPHVAGALALLIEEGEQAFDRILTESEIYALLVKRTVTLGFRKSSEGHGLVQLDYMNKLHNLLGYIEEHF